MKLSKKREQKNNKISFFKKIILKIFLFFLVLVFLFLFFLFLSKFFNNKNYPAVIFFDVGQGDAILLRNINGKNILIDGGPDNLVIKKLGKFLPYFSRRLDFVIISHYHDDHVMGLIETLRRYKIENLILAEGSKSGARQDLLLSLVLEEKNKIKIIYLDSKAEYNLGFCDLIFFNPNILAIPENNNNSLITKLACSNLNFLFSGDNELEVEKALLEEVDLLKELKIDLRAEVFKASHHGSKTSNSYEFLKMVNPDIFVISVGLNNRFNHPAQEIVERVMDMGLEIKRTDVEGDFVFPLDF
ncbi:MBL fold metallo-hydrolase [Patescibacteria group bacterium]|nr:MBL fold metallo-hydrolase [Patescibacteria group bacterium]